MSFQGEITFAQLWGRPCRSCWDGKQLFWRGRLLNILTNFKRCWFLMNWEPVCSIGQYKGNI